MAIYLPGTMDEEQIALDELTPREIVAELDKHVVGQKDAKRAVAIALRNRMRRQKLAPDSLDTSTSLHNLGGIAYSQGDRRAAKEFFQRSLAIREKLAPHSLAVATSLVFGMVAARITGETEINPGGAMGKLTQLGFGMLRPQHPSTNLMTAAMRGPTTIGDLLALDPEHSNAPEVVSVLVARPCSSSPAKATSGASSVSARCEFAIASRIWDWSSGTASSRWPI